ncbi:MAG: hypothetical protein QM691_09150 [Opitutaceae bacterium]
MRSEISYHRSNSVRRRYKYIADLDGKHRKKKLEVRIVWIGVSGPEEFFHRARGLFTRSRGPGAPLRYAAWEITAHPADKHGARRAFRDQEEMLKLGREVVKQMRGIVAMIGCHGRQDLHVLILNDGPTGLGLKSYLPNRSNPRRVMVAVVDRIEAELNEERALSGYQQLTTMTEIRAEERHRLGYTPLIEMLLDRVPEEHEPTIADLLEAVHSYGWKIKADTRKTSRKVTVFYKRGERTYEIERLHDSLLKNWWSRVHEREKERELAAPQFEAITAAIHAWGTTYEIPPKLEQWLTVKAGRLEASGFLKEEARLHPSPESEEMLAALSALNEVQRETDFVDQKADLERS